MKLLLTVILFFGFSGYAVAEDQLPARAGMLNRDISNLKSKMEKESLPGIIMIFKAVDKRFRTVIDYGDFLEKNIEKDIDHITIHSNEYWKAFYTMAPNDPNVFFARIFLLISKGYLKRAEYTMIFASHHSDVSDKPVFDILLRDMRRITSKSNDFVKQGVMAYDKGEHEKAVAFYKKALDVYPFNPHANYELGQAAFLRGAMEKNDLLKSPALKYYEKVRKYDPFFHLAYQGKNEIAGKILPIVQKINPMLERLVSGKITSKGLNQFAEACIEIGEYEFAAYAFLKITMGTFDKTKGFNLGTVKKVAECLSQLGSEEAAAFFLQQIQLYNKRLGK